MRKHGKKRFDNVVLLKKFLKRLQSEQQKFLAEPRAASDRAQNKAHWSAIFSAIAPGAATVAACVQAYALIING